MTPFVPVLAAPLAAPFLEVGACVLLSTHTAVRFDDVGWQEEVHVALVAKPGCDHVDLALPDGVDLTAWSGRVRPDASRRYPLGPERVTVTVHDPNGLRRVRWTLPELVEGDRVDLDLTRAWTRPVDYRWTPGRDHAAFAELVVPRAFTPALEGVALDKRTAWVADARPGAAAVLTHPWADRSPAPSAPASASGLTAVQAREQVHALRAVPVAWFGRAPVSGDAALALGVADGRGVARTLVALTRGGPDRVEVARWSPDADTAPALDAPEVAVWWADDGPHLLPHPDLGAPAGAWHTPSGVALARAIPPRLPAASSPPVHSEHVVVAVSGRRPLARLRVGGGLTYREEHTLTWPDADTTAHSSSTAHTAFVALPVDALDAQVTGCDHGRVAGGAVWLAAAPGTPACTWTVTRPLEDVWGTLEVPAAHATIAASWTRPDGTVTPGEAVVEPGAWRLAHLAGDTLLADRERLVEELWDRFVASSLPEPGLAVASKSGRRDWELAALLRDLTLERVTIAPLQVDPTRPRPLLAARRGRAVTEPEAAMLATLYARQARLTADTYLVRSRADGPAPGLAPLGFDHALVRLEHDGRGGWLDIACAVCGPFEVRPELLGGAALGRAYATIPVPAVTDGLPSGVVDDGTRWRLDGPVPNGVGALEIRERIDDDGQPGVTWTLSGTEALGLRRELAAVPGPHRAGWLARLLDAPSTAGLAFDGIADAGAPIRLSAPVHHPFDRDPLDVRGGDDATGGLGLRTWVRPAPPGADPAVWTCPDTSPAVAWRAWIEGHDLVEQALVRSTTLTRADLATLRACRGRLAGPADGDRPGLPEGPR
ncbi:MAG: hypothetical protein H6733_12350 [Alphaproteobacteria bacterium]|nr:hypothetical protein [Alphaproteobacteria bacterium]